MASEGPDKGEDDDVTDSALDTRKAALLAFIVRTTINDCLVNTATGKLLSIKGMDAANITCEMFRKFCSVRSITGYKGLNKEKMKALIVLRCNSKVLATSYYPEDDQDNDEGIDDNNEERDEGDGESPAEADDTFEFDAEAGVGVARDDGVMRNNDATQTAAGRAPTPTNATAPVATGTGRKARKAKPKILKSSAPKVITKEGTYYRVLNVYFDERHRPDVIQMGASSTRNELDAREFKNKRVYDALVLTYLDRETDPCDNGAMSYPDNPFFDSLGISNETPDNYNVLTSLYFAEAMDYMNHHYAVAHRNWKKSGTHDDFEKFVGQRPYLYYYFLWLQDVPILKNLAVAALPENVVQESQTSKKGTAPKVSAFNNKRQKKNDGMVAAFTAIGAASQDKVILLQKRIDQAEVQVGFARERHGLHRSRELAAAVQSYGALLEAAEQKLADLLSEQLLTTNTALTTARKMVVLWQSKLDMAVDSLSNATF